MLPITLFSVLRMGRRNTCVFVDCSQENAKNEDRQNHASTAIGIVGESQYLVTNIGLCKDARYSLEEMAFRSGQHGLPARLTLTKTNVRH